MSAVVEPDAMAADLGRKARVCEGGEWCGWGHSSATMVYRAEARAFRSQGALVAEGVCHIRRRLYRFVENLTRPSGEVGAHTVHAAVTTWQSISTAMLR